MTTTKTALVTGGSRGLGRDMALRLAENGNDVIITYHSNKEKADEVISEIESIGQKAKAFQLDTGLVSSFDAFMKSVTKYLTDENGSPEFDFLINNAGTALYSLIGDTTEEQMDDIINIHYKGVFFLTQKALPYLNHGGRIINISSGLARVSFPGSSVYGSMKGAIEVLTRYMAKELGSRKITANVVAPGAIATEFGGGSNKDAGRQEMISGFTALGRVGEAEDIGGIVSFLCSEDAGWINGQRIEASGGMML